MFDPRIVIARVVVDRVPTKVHLTDPLAVSGHVPASAACHEVADRRMEQPDLLDLADAASARVRRSRRHHREHELRGLADPAVGVLAETPAEGQRLHARIPRIAVDERGGGQRHAYLGAVLDHDGTAALQAIAVDPSGQLAVLVQPLASDPRYGGGRRKSPPCGPRPKS